MDTFKTSQRELHIRQCADSIVEQLNHGTPARVKTPRISNTGEHFLIQNAHGGRDVSEFARRVEEAIQEQYNQSIRVIGNCLNMNIILTGVSRTSIH